MSVELSNSICFGLTSVAKGTLEFHSENRFLVRFRKPQSSSPRNNYTRTHQPPIFDINHITEIGIAFTFYGLRPKWVYDNFKYMIPSFQGLANLDNIVLDLRALGYHGRMTPLEIESSSMMVSSLTELLHEVDSLQIVVGGVPLQDALKEKSRAQDEERN